MLSIKLNGIWLRYSGMRSRPSAFPNWQNTKAVIKVLIAVYCLFAKELSSLREKGATNENTLSVKYTTSLNGVFTVSFNEGKCFLYSLSDVL